MGRKESPAIIDASCEWGKRDVFEGVVSFFAQPKRRMNPKNRR